MVWWWNNYRKAYCREGHGLSGNEVKMVKGEQVVAQYGDDSDAVQSLGLAPALPARVPQLKGAVTSQAQVSLSK